MVYGVRLVSLQLPCYLPVEPLPRVGLSGQHKDGAMPLLTLPFPIIDPVALRLGPLAVKWYGLAYASGLLLGWQYVKRMLGDARLWPAGKAPFAVEKVDDMLLYMTLGVVLGGRIGYVLF